MNDIFSKDIPALIIYRKKIKVLPHIDYLRPYVISNNIQLPYIIGAWENYLKNSFLAILKYNNPDNNLIKCDKLSNDDLIKIKNNETTIEECIIKRFSFQRPKTIIDNFNMLDKTLKIGSIFYKPFKNRKETLFDSIDKMIVLRNQIVHDGEVNSILVDKDVKKFIRDITEASNRIYKLFASTYKFKANMDF